MEETLILVNNATLTSHNFVAKEEDIQHKFFRLGRNMIRVVLKVKKKLRGTYHGRM